MSTSESRTFESRVKQEVLNDNKTLKTSKFDTCLCRVLPFHYDVKMAFSTFSPFLTFQLTESRDQEIFLMLEWRKHLEHSCYLAI